MSGVAEAYARAEEGHWWFAGRRAVVLATLRRFAPPKASLLDVGCGTGGLTAALAARYRVEGVDPSADAVEEARGRGLRVRLLGLDEPLGTGFDVVTAFDVLEHVEADAAFARRLAAAARRGGLVVLTVPAFPALWGPMDEVAGHVRRYRRPQLRSVLAAAGVRGLHTTYFNTLLFPLYALARLAGFPRSGRELDPPPPVVNAVLRAAFLAESPLAARVALPFGGSILFVGRKE